MAKGSNELNMLLKARVVKIKVELDYKNSGLKGQVNKITAFLKDKPVKLKVELLKTGINNEINKLNTHLRDKKIKLGVELDSSKKTLNSQIRSLNALFKSGGLSSIKLNVDIDIKGSASKIKKQLADVNRVVQQFNNAYGKQIQQVQQNSAKLSASTGVNPNSYTNGVNSAKSYMTQVYGKGLFTSKEMKDANGVLTGFIGTLTKSDGVIQKIHYQWDANAKTFTPINRQTITETEKNVHKAKQLLSGMYTDIEKLKNGQGKTNLLNDYNAMMKNNKLSTDAVKALKNRIKEEALLNQQIKQQNDSYVNQRKLINDVKKAIKSDIKNNNASNIQGYKNILTSVRGDSSQENLKLQALRLKEINDLVKEENRLKRESIANEKKKASILQQVRKIENQTVSSDRTSQRLIREITLMAQRAKSGEHWLEVNKKMNQLKTSNSNDANIQKSIKLQFQLEQQLRRLYDLGKLTDTQLDRALGQIPNTASRGVKDLQRQVEVLNNRLVRTQAEMARASSQTKNLLVGGTTSANNFKSMVSSGDINALQKYIGQMYKGKVESIDMRDKTDKLGRAVTELKVKMAGSGKQVKTYTLQLQQATGALNQTASGLDYNANRNLGVMEQLKIAMARVPVWMVAMTAFYGTINSVKQMTQEILKLDKALTELRRVASDSISIDTVFKGALQLSKELGNNIHDVMQAVNDLARTFGDFNERQLLAITRTAILMSNVSDLTAQDATNTLVGTMNAFNISAEESIRIVDALNEVDNDYAISTQQLATGLSKSASTSKTFGVTLEENIGHITAIGAVTMESGNIIGNSLKTIYSRITTMDESRGVLQSVGVAIDDMNGNVRDASDIIEDLASRWNYLSDSERQNIAVKVAGRYQLSRFLALMNNYETAQNAIVTAVHSEGSAMRENAEYLKSFEARINSLKNTWTELSSTMGNAILSDGLMVAIGALGKFAEAGIWVAETFGALPVVFGAVATGLLAFGVFNKLRTSMVNTFDVMSVHARLTSTAIGGIRGQFMGAGAGAVAFGQQVRAGMASAIASVKAFSIAWKSMLASTIIGGAFVLIGIAIEKLISHMAEQKRQQEELEKLNKKMIDGYRKYRDGMSDVIDRYEELRNKTRLTKEETEEYNFLQKELAENIPTTVEYIDANGVAHMKTTEEIRKEIDAVKELSKANAELDVAKFTDNMKEQSKTYKEVSEEVDKLREKQKELVEENGKTYNQTYSKRDGDSQVTMGTHTVDNTKDIQENKVAILMAEAEKTEALKVTLKTIQQQTLAYFEANNMADALSDEQQKVIENFISQNEYILRNASNFEDAYLGMYEMGKQVGNVWVEAYDLLSEQVDPSSTMGLDALKTNLDTISKSIPKTFYSLTDENGRIVKSSADVTNGLKEIINISNEMHSAGENSTNEFIFRLRALGMTSDEAKGYLFRLSNENDNLAIKSKLATMGVDATTGAIEDLNEATLEAIDLTQTLFGYGQTDLQGVKSHIQNMHLLIDVMGEGAKTNKDYLASQEALSDFFGVTATEIEQNIDYYYNLTDALLSLDLSSYDMDTSWSKFIDASELDDEMKKVLKNWDGYTDLFTKGALRTKEEVGKSADEIVQSFTAPFASMESIKFPDVDYTSVKNSNVYVKQATDDIQGNIEGLLEKAGEFGVVFGQPTGVQFLDELMGDLETSMGRVSITEENVEGLRLILSTLSINPQLANSIASQLGIADIAIDTTGSKIDTLKTKSSTDFGGGALNTFNSEVKTAQQGVDDLNTSISNTALQPRIDVAGLVKTNGIDTARQSVDSLSGSIDNAVSKGSSVSVISSDIDIIMKQTQDLNNALGEVGNGFNTENIRTQIKSIGEALTSVNVKLSALNSNLKGYLDIAPIQTYINALNPLLGVLALTPQYTSVAVQAINSVRDAFVNTTGIANSYTQSLTSSSNITTSSYQALAQAISGVTAVIIKHYNDNSTALSNLASSTKTSTSDIVVSFATMVSLVGIRVKTVANVMNKEFQTGINSLLAKARLLPTQIANAIRSNIGQIRSAMRSVSSVISNTKLTNSTAKISGYANGGIIDKMELAWHGEEGAEAIIPLISKRRNRGLELWEETGKRLGVDEEAIELMKKLSSAKGSGGQSNATAGSFGATSGEGGEGGGGDSGSSGTLIPSKSTTLTGSYNLSGGYNFHALATDDYSSDSEISELFKVNYNERALSSWESKISIMESKMQRLNATSKEYRKILGQVISAENSRMSIITKEIKSLESSNAQISKRLEKLKNTSKHTKEQRDEYNQLQQDYESNLGKLYQYKSEIENIINDIRDKSEEVFSSIIEEITQYWDEAISAIEKRVDNIDFKIELLDVIDSENSIEKIDLLSTKVRELAKQQGEYVQAQKDIESQIREATAKFGKDSEVVKGMISKLEELRESWEDITLEIAQTEKEIKELRGEIADGLLDSVKEYYEEIKDVAEKSNEAEIESAKKAHDEKMKLYDEESKRISDLYDEKIASIDKANDEETYQRDLEEKTSKLSTLKQKEILYSQDNSLEGRKKLAETRSEIQTLQDELNEFIKDRQRELLKDELTKEKEGLIEKLEQEKELEEKAHDEMIDRLEAESDAIAKHYEDAINNEERWAEIRSDLMKGNFTLLNQELNSMGINLEQLSDGTFNTLSENFNSYSKQVRDFVLEINSMIREINSVTGSSNGFTPDGGVAISEPINPYSVPSLISKAYSGEELMTSTEDKDYLYNLIQDSGISEYRMGEIWRKAQSGIALDLPTPDQMEFYNLFQEILRGSGIKRFNTGGYTGDWTGNEGRLAIVDKKEYILDESDTSNLLNVVKLVDKIQSIMPNISKSNMTDKLSTANKITNTNNYELTVNIDNLNGDKKGAKTVVKEIMSGLKKMGK